LCFDDSHRPLCIRARLSAPAPISSPPRPASSPPPGRGQNQGVFSGITPRPAQ
jgi:hypothetical protein